MTQVPAPIKKPTLPDLTTLLDTLKREIMADMNCAKVGIVQSFDATLQEVEVKIAYTQVTSISTDGVRTLAEYPLLLRVPAQFVGGGGFTLTFPVAAGDECLVVFNDQQIDNWVLNGAGQPPSVDRVHDLSDGMAILGFRSNPRALQDVSTEAAQLRSDDGTTFVEVNAQGVKIHSGTVYEWDVQGYGQKITWTGGANYTIDNYVTGAVVTTNSHPIAPPGPP